MREIDIPILNKFISLKYLIHQEYSNKTSKKITTILISLFKIPLTKMYNIVL